MLFKYRMTQDSFVRGPNGSIRGHKNQVSNSVQRIISSNNCLPIVNNSSRSSVSSSSYSSDGSSDSDSDFNSGSMVSSTISSSLLESLLQSQCSLSSCRSSIDLTSTDSGNDSAISSEDVLKSLKKKWLKKRMNNSFLHFNKQSVCDDHVVLYSTSIGVIRSTFEACNKLR